MCKESRRQRQRSFYKRRKAKIISYLGGKCVECGKTHSLEIDHIDPSTKEFNPLRKWSYKWGTLTKELDKCELRCSPCHADRTIEEGHLITDTRPGADQINNATRRTR